MKFVAVASVALVAPHVCGFVAPASRALTSSKTHVRGRSCMMVAEQGVAEKETIDELTETPQIFVVGEITEDNKKSKYSQAFLDTGVVFQPEVPDKGDGRSGPASYIGLVDGDTFDGGDGQVGVVGDGTNHMEQFDTSEIVKKQKQIQGKIMVKESKAQQRNAWGSGTGYAEELAEKGMVKIDKETGADMLKVRRQQFENYRNQQELQAQQRAKIAQLEAMTGEEQGSTSWKRGAGRSYMDALAAGGVKEEEQAWNKFTAPAAGTKSDGSAWKELVLKGDEKLEATVQCISSSGRPGFATIEVRNSVMTFEPFNCQFSGDHDGFSVEPKTGTLNKRKGAPIPVTVSYKASGPGDQRDALLVIETEEDKWIYKIEGRTS